MVFVFLEKGEYQTIWYRNVEDEIAKNLGNEPSFPTDGAKCRGPKIWMGYPHREIQGKLNETVKSSSCETGFLFKGWFP